MTNRERFEVFHENNPEVYEELVKITRKQTRFGYEVSIKGVFEVLRYQVRMKIQDPSQNHFKLNNDYTPYYARLIMENEPDLRGEFQTRETVTE